jgi:hypothetical protein
MVFEYRLDSATHFVHCRLLDAGAFERARQRNFMDAFWRSGIYVAGVYCAWSTGIGPLVVAFAVSLVAELHAAATYSRRYWKTVEEAARRIPARDVRLEVTNEGLHETAGSIRSFVPWNGVVGFTQFDQTLFIELEGRYWSIVPARTLSGASSSLEAFCRLLREKSIKEKSSGLTFR